MKKSTLNSEDNEEAKEEEVTDPLIILNRERELQRLMFSNNKSMRPDIIERLKASNTKEVLQMALNSKNIRNVSLWKAFGIYRKPLNKNLYFVSDSVLVFLISNYLAIQDIEGDKTEYVELSSRVESPTAIYWTKWKEETSNAVNRTSNEIK